MLTATTKDCPCSADMSRAFTLGSFILYHVKLLDKKQARKMFTWPTKDSDYKFVSSLLNVFTV